MHAHDQLYRDILLEHWRHPQNYGVISKPSFDVNSENPVCGDRLHMTGNIVGGILTDFKFTAQACVICTAYASLLSEQVTGQECLHIIDMPEKGLVGHEKNLPIGRLDCAFLSMRLLKKVLLDQDISTNPR